MIAPLEAQPHEPQPPRALTSSALAMAGCAAAAIAFAISLGLNEPLPAVDAALVAWITLSYVLGGLVAWTRRPESTFGPLMVAAGFGPMLSRLSELEAGLLQAIGDICRLLPVVLFAHVFLAYPSGRLRSKFERALITFGYVAAVGFSAEASLLGARRLEIVSHPAEAELARNAGLFAIVAFVLIAFGLLLARARRSKHARRSIVVACFGLTFLAVGAGLVARTLGWPAATPIKWVAFSLIAVAPVLFVGGFVRSRLARSAIADLFVELRAEPAPVALRDALARALNDEELDLVYWLPEFGSYANLDGTAVDLNELGADRVVTLIDGDDAHLGALVHDPALGNDSELLEAATAAAAISLENGRLHAELRARLAELRGSRARILQAGQQERQRLERNLHDGAQQRLIALSLELGLLEGRLVGDPDARDRLRHARGEIARSLEELRDVARGIHPAVVSGHGLSVALEQLVVRAPVSVDLRVAVAERLPEHLEVAAYYVVAESLSNVAKHSEARAASVDVASDRNGLVLEITDDGVGGADPERGSGLRGLADRVEALNGRLQVWTPRGGGTRVRAEIPCA